MSTVLVTGGTGALGRHVVDRFTNADEIFVLTRDPGAPYAPPAREAESRVRLVRGDITVGPSLGLDGRSLEALRESITDVVHCAACTTFTAPLTLARAVNVLGTQYVLDFARTCRRLERVTCASTAYVAGRRTGRILESDTDAPGFVNSYEQSKHEMEAVVREAMPELPVCVCRLTTVIGDSVTGRVTGFNAIHHALRLLYRGLAPMIPGTPATPVDLIPIDFAATAVHRLATSAFRRAATYHVCAGARGACTLDELLDVTLRVFERTRPMWRKQRVEAPAIVDRATYALFVRSVEESGNVVLADATRSVGAFADQLAYPKVFDTSAADQALAASGVHAPAVLDFYDRIVAWCVETGWSTSAATGRE
jgi:nucleoside-diphosphate-sugar epimerase